MVIALVVVAVVALVVVTLVTLVALGWLVVLVALGWLVALVALVALVVVASTGRMQREGSHLAKALLAEGVAVVVAVVGRRWTGSDRGEGSDRNGIVDQHRIRGVWGEVDRYRQIEDAS